ncbi:MULTISPECIES: hemerythrin domain-containing protein [unclassified Actinomadura]|uniref:hemerythrin domain-containing protein n=1 Tax=unclassified Actinomadura TaxID=2626254 RepID=UPI0011EC2BAC|nr:hemerythrin domain-containing protein [Actinomadura sp. K4S16]
MDDERPEGRDDLFTHIHKALRNGLFAVTVQAGATDWADAAEVAALGERWRRLLALLRSHTEHEDQHILRLLDPHEPGSAEPTEEQHRDLDDLLDDLAGRFEAVLAAPGAAAGLDLYRDLARFTAAYLPHLHEEETLIMPRIWAHCDDAEIGAARVAFMAATPPEITATTLELLLPALDRPTREGLVAGMARTAPPQVLAGVLAIADRVLPAQAATSLRHAATTATMAG